ncbi:MAG TPA: hypothetical protein EYO46_04980 [Candidatus Lambdaproteobacteria bacterium]|jgi:hypothetical protein|nr:hypothetical protein [Candidatus Lambdaproteobacteria bacterium]HIB45569.1 hypothetical protein [Candidatus Lambdaproteobacteria bacterium]HIN47938.1 hypothetical protein [Deltaproteobacteria bacterium]HIO11577.1 hypothetical protein [Deltaproteobacteria bacterium]HIO61276.1 hypothetical protein [Deltaproteobacteria bacterium]
MIDDMELSSSDQELLTDVNTAIVRFIKSDETFLQMEPMNAYRRRMVHKIGADYKLSSESTGDGENRSVRLSKTPETTIPENINSQRVIDRGIEIFYAKPGAEIVLRKDGSFGVSLKERESKILDRRTVVDGEFRIRENKIICKQDSNW